MAITRCPYCHAIIDENDKYCNNCGTQLLFPEDDEVDEEIPGEKIVDAEVEEKDYTVEEPEDEKSSRAAKDPEEDLDEELEEEMREEEAEKALDELVAEEDLEEEAEGATEEVILVDEIAAPEAERKAATGEIKETGGPLEEEKGQEEKAAAEEKEDEEKEGTEEEEEEEVEPSVEYLTGPAEGTEAEDIAAATAGESALRPVTFDTNELEGLGRTVELSKEKIEQFIQGRAEKPPAETPEKPETAEIAEAPAPVSSETTTPAPGPGPEGVRESTGSLPPWASTMKGAPVFPPDTTPVEPKKGPASPPATEEEVEIFPRRKPSDSTLGLPERLSQAPLPFGEQEPETEEEAEAEEEVEVETLEAVPPPAGSERPSRPPVLPVREPGRVESAVLDETEAPVERPPFSFSVFFKSKAFDVLFVGLFWLVALWLAAHATGQTLFEILGAVSGPMLLLYAVFVLLYFFLFKFFLGETLGDRLFRHRD